MSLSGCLIVIAVPREDVLILQPYSSPYIIRIRLFTLAIPICFVSIISFALSFELICARTSAANKGLSVATCPIDANYTGEVLAIVHNTSNDIIKYKAGESFCQYVTCKINVADVPCKKEGKRSISNLGGTGNAGNS